MSTLAQLLSYANTGAALSGAGMLALYITPYNFVVKQAALRFITESPLIRKVRACVCCMQFVLLACILALGGVGVGVGARSSVLRVCCCACGVVWWLYGVQLHVASGGLDLSALLTRTREGVRRAVCAVCALCASWPAVCMCSRAALLLCKVEARCGGAALSVVQCVVVL